MSEPNPGEKPKRRPRYSGKNPRKFGEKYKELDPARYPEMQEHIRARGKTPAGTHVPIMVEEVLAALCLSPGKKGIDATMGYGGHAKAILTRLTPDGMLIGVDQDPVELPKTEARLRALGFGEANLVIRQTNFAGIPGILRDLQIPAVDFILADLGVSSMQLDNPARGFSCKVNGPLDLRMNPAKGIPASEWLKRTPQPELANILREFSDEPRAEEIATLLTSSPMETTQAVNSRLSGHFRLSLDETTGMLQRVFQAMRIAVNDELGVLKQLLRLAPQCLNTRGRFAVLSFHSGEDRLVKKSFESFRSQGLYSEISDMIRPGPEELRANPRSSPAKLRWARKR